MFYIIGWDQQADYLIFGLTPYTVKFFRKYSGFLKVMYLYSYV